MTKCDWQTIESAPRDGRKILIFVRREGVTEARYDELIPGKTFEGDDDSTGGYWICCDNKWRIEVTEMWNLNKSDVSYDDGQVTHWMPLPEPPK